jgi:hypothetical protein
MAKLTFDAAFTLDLILFVLLVGFEILRGAKCSKRIFTLNKCLQKPTFQIFYLLAGGIH